MTEKLRELINEYFIGNDEVVENILICLLAGGHVLIEDVPGVGKTTLVKTLAAAVDLDFGRIQFTPDTLPSDVTGSSVLNMKTGEFEYREGAIMHRIILADEINRTSPKTQAALLEAMAEGRVTVDDKVIDLPDPFMIIANQNPSSFVGTYPLPEAQLDRFMMKLSIGYPTPENEIILTRNFIEGKTVDKIKIDVDVFQGFAYTRNHRCQLLDVTHLLDLLDLGVEVAEVELVLANLLLQSSCLLFVVLFLGTFHEADDVTHSEDAVCHASGVEGVDGFHLLACSDELDGLVHNRTNGEGSTTAGVAV